MTKKLGFAIAALCAIAVAIATNVQDVGAADHLDPAGRIVAGQAADIGDIYAWNRGENIVTALTFAGPNENTEGTYSRDTLYAINIDGADEGFEPDTTIWARFGQNEGGEWGVWVQNVPGTSANTVGPVETNIAAGESAQVFAGQLDDPFFMDLQGFNETLSTGTLAFDPERDFFEGLNITALVVEFPKSALDFAGPYHFWATTADQ
ncbi:MAG: hypothetical protein ACI9KE_002998 [Polyangiales bacterium]|jgi:hypothetical protein